MKVSFELSKKDLRFFRSRLKQVRTAGGSVRIFVDTLWRKGEVGGRRQPVGDQRRAG